MKNIVIEDRLTEIFNFLPPRVSANNSEFKCVFGYGDEKELKVFLKAKESEAKRPYPLIWLVYPLTEKHTKKEVFVKDMTLILAVNTSKTMTNVERIKSTIGNILMPLKNDIMEILQSSVTTRFWEKCELTKFPNYSDSLSLGEANFTSEIWDAVEIKFDIVFNANCIREIKLTKK